VAPTTSSDEVVVLKTIVGIKDSEIPVSWD